MWGWRAGRTLPDCGLVSSDQLNKRQNEPWLSMICEHFTLKQTKQNKTNTLDPKYKFSVDTFKMGESRENRKIKQNRKQNKQTESKNTVYLI